MLNLPDKLVRQIDQITDPLQRALLDVLRERVGRDRAIGRLALLRLVRDRLACARAAGRCTRPLLNVRDRELRTAINQLRNDGQPICSAPGRRGGYYMAADGIELRRFLQRELDTRIRSLVRTRRRMFAGGLAIFGRQGQLDFERIPA